MTIKPVSALRQLALVSLSAVALSVAIPPATSVLLHIDSGSAYAKSEKAKKNQSSKKPKKSNRSSNSNKSSNSGSNRGQAKKQASLSSEISAAPGQAKEKNIHAQLAGLNSLKRNVNGLMNSSDPRMTLVRQYVVDNAEYEIALANLAAAQETLGTAQGTFATLVGGVVDTLDDTYPDYAGADYATLQSAYDDLLANPVPEVAPEDPAYADYLAYQDELAAVGGALETINASPEAAELITAQNDVTIAEGEALIAEEGTADEDLVAALEAAANKNRLSEDYVSPEILEWAKQTLGTGDYDGTIDDYLNQLLAAQ